MHAGRPSRPGTDGHDSASPGRPTAWRHQVGPPGSWTWASFARAHNASSARALTQSQARRQPSTTARRRRRTATRRTSCRHRRNAWAYQRGRPAIPLQDPAVGGRGHGWTYAEAWTCCTARHLTGTGASAGLHSCTDRLPRRYTHLIVLLKIRGRGQQRLSGPGSRSRSFNNLSIN